jgi:hypothetical protein
MGWRVSACAEIVSDLPVSPGKKMVYVCHDNKTVMGPETIDEVAEKVLDHSYSPDLAVLAVGTEDWTTFKQIRSTWPSPRMVELLRQRVEQQEQAAAEYLQQEMQQETVQVAAQAQAAVDKVGTSCGAVVVLILFMIILVVVLSVVLH